ncbi:MAG: TonB-dependent siderophore receptor [Salinisphaeraceae bacterium]
MTRRYRGMPAVAGLAMGLGLLAPGLAAAQKDAGNGATELGPISVEARGESATGPVDGYKAERSTTATKTDIPLIESPQSVSVISREQLEDRQADNLAEAVAYTPGIYVQNRAAQRVIDSFSIDIRGFSAQNATYRDGTQIQAGLVYDSPLETYAFDRIEILRGPASILYGQAQPGGIINLVTKKPTAQPLREIGLEIGGDGHKQATVDISDRIDDNGDWRYRLTGLVQRADTFIDFVNDDSTYVAPSLTWQPTDATSLTLLTHYQSYETRYPWTAFPRQGTADPGQFGQVPDNRYIGEPEFDRYDSQEWAAGYLFEHEFSEVLTFRQNLRYREIEYDVLDTFRNYFGPYIDNDLRTLVDRGQRIRFDEGDTLTVDNRLIGKLRFGAVQHTVLAGIDYKTLTLDTQTSGFVPINGPASDLDLFNPVYGRDFVRPSLNPATSTDADQIGLYLQDHIKFNERWVVSLGGRQDWVEEETTGQPTEDQDELSLRAGVVYLAGGGWAPYASYSESFTPNYGENQFTGKAYDPQVGEQLEAGLRYRPPGSGLSATVAVFDITRENEVVQNPANPGNPMDQVQIGETESTGAELEVIADLTANLQVIAGYTWQQVEVGEAGGAQATNGNRLSNKPEHLANLWLDYTLYTGPLAGLGLGAGVRYTGSSFADGANTVRFPSATLVDAAVRYDLAGNVGLQLAANNLFDEQPIYCSGTAPTSTCDYGIPRQVIGSLTYRWQ